jgi:hypothetical protein
MSLFILGAGFSRPAGLPLGNELFPEILMAAKSRGLYSGLKDDIDAFLDYSRATKGVQISEEQINFEEFMSYIDIDRHLALRGGDTSSSQEILKNLLAYVLYDHEIKITDQQFLLFENFADRLGTHDIVLTFNYDTILEKTLDRKNIPYRLYDDRYRFDKKTNTLVLDWKAEIVILKMHGSINWFDKTDYLKAKEELEFNGIYRTPQHLVFDGRMDDEIHRLLDEPFQPSDPFRNMYIVKNLDKYFNQNVFWQDAPFIIPPSYQKLVNLNYLRDFWYRFSSSGGLNKKIVIIGFSLPDHDEYIRQPLYWLIRNFQNYEEPEMEKKSRLKIIDYKQSGEEIGEFKNHYRFVDLSKTDSYFGGFCEDALNIIFSDD